MEDAKILQNIAKIVCAKANYIYMCVSRPLRKGMQLKKEKHIVSESQTLGRIFYC